MNGLTAYALALELNGSIAGSRVTGICNFYNGMTLELGRGTLPFLHIFYSRREAELLPSQDPVAEGRSRSKAFEILLGARITGVQSLGMDRILLLSLESDGTWGNKERFILRINLTPSGRPVALFHDEKGRLIESVGGPKTRIPCSPTEIPATRALTLLDLPQTPPASLLAAAGGPDSLMAAPVHTRRWEMTRRAAAVITRNIGGVDPVLARALMQSTGGEIAAAWEPLLAIGTDAAAGRFSWSIYEFPESSGSVRLALYPVRLPLEALSTKCVDMRDAFSRIGREFVIPSFIEDLRARALSSARRDIRKAQRLISHLTQDLEEAGRSKEYRHFGNLLVTHRHMIKPGMREISLRDFSGERTITVLLDPARTPEKNISTYFKKAKKGEKGILLIRDRRRKIERDLEEKQKSSARIRALATIADLLDAIPSGRRIYRRDVDSPGFRSFKLDEHNTIYVGRNGRDNDRLTHRFASPRDMWFHAQGVSGSHVILKSNGSSIPKRILERAAAAAAFFSKSRGAGTVPVIVAEKRYVHKPRSTAPGTAVCQRSKTLFVTPASPDKADRG